MHNPMHFVAHWRVHFALCCARVEREVSEWGRPQMPSAPPWPHHSSTILIIIIVIAILIFIKHWLCLVEARIPISRMRNPQIISVTWADNKLFKYFQAVNFAHIFLPPWFWLFHKTYPGIVYASSLFIVVHYLQWPGLNAVAVPAFITRTIYSAFVIWERLSEKTFVKDAASPAFVCFIWIR